MTDSFAALIPDARCFLNDLSQTNTRAWFTTHKARYDGTLKRPAILLLDHLSAQLARKTALPIRTKLFRPHRDVRFSKDKTPYTTHLHMLWQVGSAGLFFGIAPEYVRLGGGVMAMDKDQLTRWRDAMADDRRGAGFWQLCAPLADQGFSVDHPELKRVPAPFPKDHPRENLLRRKSMTFWRDMPAQEWPLPSAALDRGFDQLLPMVERLNLLI